MGANDMQITCDFCSKDKHFNECRQVPLRVDKDNVYQLLFAWICKDCSAEGIRKTVNNQFIKSMNSRSREEKTVFDARN
jgi:hypothetical protein